MNEIKCPNCHKIFNLDEAGYADILSQVRNEAFDKALNERLMIAEQDKKNAVELAETKVISEMDKITAKKEAEIERLKAELKSSAEIIQAKVVGEFNHLHHHPRRQHRRGLPTDRPGKRLPAG